MSKTQRCNNVRFWSEQRPSKYNIDTTLPQRLPMSRPKENKKKKLLQRLLPAGSIQENQ